MGNWSKKKRNTKLTLFPTGTHPVGARLEKKPRTGKILLSTAVTNPLLGLRAIPTANPGREPSHQPQLILLLNGSRLSSIWYIVHREHRKGYVESIARIYNTIYMTESIQVHWRGQVLSLMREPWRAINYSGSLDDTWWELVNYGCWRSVSVTPILCRLV